MAEESKSSLYSMLLELRDRLAKNGDRLVLAESCTAGLVAAKLGSIPGISEYLCGSMVVYRTATKNAWLGIEERLLYDPHIGPVSSQVTEALAQAMLRHTPEATIAAAVTGHLGPGAPDSLDGIVYCSVVRRNQTDRLLTRRIHLQSPTPQDANDLERRSTRQSEAAEELLSHLSSCIR